MIINTIATGPTIFILPNTIVRLLIAIGGFKNNNTNPININNSNIISPDISETYGFNFRLFLAEKYVILFFSTFAITGVAFDFVAELFNLPKSIEFGLLGVPTLEDLTWTFHVLFLNFAVKSAAPLLPGLRVTLDPFDVKSLAINFSLLLPYLYLSVMIKL